jgi:hypothetical protein
MYFNYNYVLIFSNNLGIFFQNEMISSIVHVTNLPRKVVLQWFEDKREQDGVPQELIIPARYQRRSVSKTVSR